MTDEKTIIEEYITSARQLYSDGLIEEAETKLQQAISSNPNSLESMHDLGMVALSMGNLELAIELFKRAIDIEPSCVSAHYNIGCIRMDQGMVDEAIESFTCTLRLEPEYTNAHYNLGFISLDLGHIDQAIGHFRKTIESDPEFFLGYFNLAKAYSISGNFQEALRYYRKCVEMNPQDESLGKPLGNAQRQIEIIEELAKPDLSNIVTQSIKYFHNDNIFQNYKKSLAAKRGDNQIILVISFPKSGSTYLANSLLTLSDYRWFRLCYRFDQNEHDLYLPYLSLCNTHGVVSLLHMKGTKPNVELLNLYGIKPIISVRNIYDTIASLLNNINQGKMDSTKALGNPFIWQDEQIMALPDERKIDCLIDMAVPWCIYYYVSWYYFTKTGQIEAMWVDFDKQMANWEETLREVCNFTGLAHKCTDEAISQLKQPRHSPYILGKSGDINLLSAKQRQRILDMVSYYPDVDFAEYGFLDRDAGDSSAYSLGL